MMAQEVHQHRRPAPARADDEQGGIHAATIAHERTSNRTRGGPGARNKQPTPRCYKRHPMNVAIVTARAGSKSIIDKNVLPLRGKPMVQYPIHAAQAASRIGGVYVSTDGEAIAAASRDAGATVIPRPDELGGDSVNHGIVIKHAVEWVDARVPDLENIVLLLGNTV